MTTLLITMAGLGSRFAAAGYTVPKYMIEAKGSTLFAWSMLSLKGFLPATRCVFVVRREDGARDFIASECSRLGIGPFEVVEIDALTNGQATTALLGLDHCDEQAPIAIFNIDTHVEPGRMQPPRTEVDGYIPCFRAPGNHWSFVKTGPDGLAVEVREKQRISDLATVGLYWFSSPSVFRDLYRRHFTADGGGLERGEAYIAPMYNTMIAEGAKVAVAVIEYEDVVPLGTPAELDLFIHRV